MEKSVAVLGSGSWSTAIAKILTNNGFHVNWWIREHSIIEGLKVYGHNPIYLSSVKTDSSLLTLFSDINSCIEQSDIIIFSIPSAFLDKSLENTEASLFENKRIVSAIKGIVPEYNLIVGEYFHTKYGIPYDRISIISGPSHAEEVAQEKLTYLTFSSKDQVFVEELAALFSNRYIRTKLSNDIFGVEYATVLKNVIAIASGAASALGYGDNFQAVLVSNAIREIKHFIDIVHPIDRDIKNSAYLGDLLVTTYSQFSRNRLFGIMLGKGYSVKSAQVEMSMIAEGYYAVKGIQEIKSKYKIEMPIVEAVYNIIYEGIAANIEMKILSDKLD